MKTESTKVVDSERESPAIGSTKVSTDPKITAERKLREVPHSLPHLQQSFQRRVPVGAELSEAGTHFRVWAPSRKSVEVLLDASDRHSSEPGFPLRPKEGGYYEGLLEGIGPGARYWFRLDGDQRFPDPASRFQPEGVHGPSEVVDPSRFAWTDSGWAGVSIHGQVLYELHIGTFTQAGTWAGASRELSRLAATGITTVEVMPVAEFPGEFGWGYDGVDWFAPFHKYGSPDDFRKFVNAAHAHSLGVILDVVYNHFGPDGNYLREFSPDYFSHKSTEWGEAINYDGACSEHVREFVLANIQYWIEEFHVDGFRLDATQQIFDSSRENIVTAINRRARKAAGKKNVIVIAENEENDTDLVHPIEDGGSGLDAMWNDDFHHAAYVALTGHNPAYYSGFSGRPQEFISAAKYGPLYQGQHYRWQKRRRGTADLNLPPSSAVVFLENHDQVSNSQSAGRLVTLSAPGAYRAISALFLLSPGTPLLFQGQEIGATQPFHYFADHHTELSRLVKTGREKFLSQFPELSTPEAKAALRNPGSRETFERCKIDWSRGDERYGALYADLLRLRRSEPAFSAQQRGRVDGAVLAPACFVLRYLGNAPEDRLVVVNLGLDLFLDSAPEPLLAPPRGMSWALLWSSEHPAYGGSGTPGVETSDGWRLPGQSAVVLGPRPAS